MTDPALVAVVSLDEPWPRYHGGEVAAPAFAAMAQRVLLYLGVPPERRLQNEAERELDIRVASWGDQVAMPTLLEPSEANDEDEAVALAWRLDETSEVSKSEVPDGTVPNLVGLSARQALARSRGIGLQLALNGHGAVVRQLPAPGTPLETTGGAVEVWLTAGGP